MSIVRTCSLLAINRCRYVSSALVIKSYCGVCSGSACRSNRRSRASACRSIAAAGFTRSTRRSPDYPAHGRRQERVVRAAEYDLVGSGIEHRAEQFVDPCQRFGRLLAVAFDQFDETFPDLRQDFHPVGIALRRFAEQTAVQRRRRRQNSDHSAARCHRRRLYGRFEPDQRQRVVPPQVIDRHRRRGVAGDDDQFDASVDQPPDGQIDVSGHLFAVFVSRTDSFSRRRSRSAIRAAVSGKTPSTRSIRPIPSRKPRSVRYSLRVSPFYVRSTGVR